MMISDMNVYVNSIPYINVELDNDLVIMCEILAVGCWISGAIAHDIFTDQRYGVFTYSGM